MYNTYVYTYIYIDPLGLLLTPTQKAVVTKIYDICTIYMCVYIYIYSCIHTYIYSYTNKYAYLYLYMYNIYTYIDIHI